MTLVYSLIPALLLEEMGEEGMDPRRSTDLGKMPEWLMKIQSR